MIYSLFKSMAMLFFSSYISGMSISCVDVGQGNCTVIVPKEPSSHILVVDCGSSSNKARATNIRKNYKDTLALAIVETIADSTKNKAPDKCVVFVITHADEDHCNLLCPIIESLLNPPYEIPVRKIFLGGYLEDYSSVSWKGTLSSFNDFLALIHKEFKVEAHFPSQEAVPTTVPGGYATLLVLPKEKAPARTSKKYDTNQMSLIVQVVNDGKKCLIMGDATNSTVNYHIAQLGQSGAFPSLEDLESDIYIASHHGASLDCNSSAWLKIIKPKFIIVSSGVHSLFRHPREKALQIFIKQLTDTSAPLHSLYFGLEQPENLDERPDQLHHALFEDGYGVTLSNKHVYGTLGQGDIIFTLETGLPVSQPECSRPYSHYSENLPDAILKRCSPTSDEGKSLIISEDQKPLKDPCFSLDKVVYLNLSTLVDFSKPVNTVNSIKVLDTILEYLIQKANNLQQLHCNENGLTGYSTILGKIAQLIDQRKTLTVLKIKNNSFSPTQVTALQSHWGYRGLDL